MKIELPPFAVTGIGSLPSEDIEEAFSLIESGSPQIPYAPQIAAAEGRQMMIPQLLSGLAEPILGPMGGGPYKITPPQTRDLFEAISASANSEIHLENARYSGLLELAARVAHGRLSQAFAVKTQIVGPITAAGAFVCDQVNLATDYSFIDELSNLIGKTAQAQIEFLKQNTGLPILVWLDEPLLEIFIAQSDQYLKRAGLDILKLLVGAIRDMGAVVGIHCCSFPPFEALLGMAPDIISIDAWNGHDSMLDHSAIEKMIETQITLALGIVPTDRSLDVITVGELKSRIEKLVKPYDGSDISALKLMLTPTCGLALNSIPQAHHAFELLSDLRLNLLA
jgi:hypothetical protein